MTKCPEDKLLMVAELYNEKDWLMEELGPVLKKKKNISINR